MQMMSYLSKRNKAITPTRLSLFFFHLTNGESCRKIDQCSLLLLYFPLLLMNMVKETYGTSQKCALD